VPRLSPALRLSGPFGRKALGIAFLCLLVVFGWLTYATFTKKFVDVVPVTLQTGKIGLQMEPLADVKIRGVLVGEVREMRSEGDGAVLDLALDPNKVGSIPANVSAVILPKTLFGEKYVALQVPEDAASESLSAGDVIERTQTSIEVEKVLSDLYPLLRAVRPADLSATLNAMATALEGRGARLGDNLVRLDGYLKRLNPLVPGMIEDLRLLTTVSDNYAEVLPELGRFLRNQATTGDTLVEKEEELRALFTDVAGFSETARDFLEVNEDNIIRLGEVSVPTLSLLEEYSPEYPCLLDGIVNWIPIAEESYRNYTLHINLETLPFQPTGYGPADAPKYGAEYGPACATLPNPPYSQANPAPMPDFARGVEEDDGIAGTHGKYRAAPDYGSPLRSAGNQSSSASNLSSMADESPSVTSGWAGTAAEQRLVDALAAPVLDVPAKQVPDVATLLVGPIARGAEVSVR
jgi:phospholipid/cholesterol/gamma-HCH transport system substrate-binding protein